MLVRKITHGFVVQVFDTEKGRFVSQEFVAGDEVAYEDSHGEAVDSDMVAAYLPFHMVQPETDDGATRSGPESR